MIASHDFERKVKDVKKYLDRGDIVRVIRIVEPTGPVDTMQEKCCREIMRKGTADLVSTSHLKEALDGQLVSCLVGFRGGQGMGCPLAHIRTICLQISLATFKPGPRNSYTDCTATYVT